MRQSSPERSPILRCIAFWALTIVCGLGLIATVAVAKFHLDYQRETLNGQKEALQAKTRSGAQQINTILRSAMEAAETIAGQISSGELDRQSMLDSLSAALSGNEHFYGGTITFRPFRFDPETRLYSAYYYKDNGDSDGKLQFQQLDELYDYTTDEYDWYSKPMVEGNRWGEPYWDEAGKTLMVTYSAVFYLTDPDLGTKERGGVVTIDLSMDGVRRLIKNIDLGPFGFGALTTSEGTYLYHPNDEYVTQKRKLQDVARAKADPDRLVMAEAARNRESGILDHISTTTGQSSWLVFEPVPISGWSLQNTYIKQDFIESRKIRRHWMLISAGATIFLLTLIALALRLHHFKQSRLWAMSVVTTLIFMSNIAFVWGLALTQSPSKTAEDYQVTDKATLGVIKKLHDRRCEALHRPPPVYVPTGLQIETLELDQNNYLRVGGAIWQRLPAASHPGGTSPPFRFAHSKNVKVTEVFQREEKGHTLTLWNFFAEIQQKLRSSEYPLDQESLKIKILSTDQNWDLALVPDLDSYSVLMPSSKPGIHRDVFLSGWQVSETAFELRPYVSRVNIVRGQSVDNIQFPTLQFNISMRRDFIDAFLSNLTPLILVAIMLFAILLLQGTIDYSRALSICVGMLFVIVFSHVGIRNKISSDHIFYLEYFYFIIYCAILWVSLNSICKPLGIRWSLLEKHNHLFPRIAYWPFLLGVLVVATFVTFYTE